MTPADPTVMPLAAEVAGVAPRYRLQLGARRFRGRLGGRAGHGVGSSMEFFDFRAYAPGDDLRHLDWRGYARSGELRVRLHQEEVAPYVDLLVDTSASMASTPQKERAVRILAAALVAWAQRDGATARAQALGGGLCDAADLAFAGDAAGPGLPNLPLRPGSVRVLLTDGLWQQDPAPALQRLMVSASRFFCLQLLDPWELDPGEDDALTLVDCETGARAEVQLDARSVAGYRDRLQRLCAGLRATVLGQGGLCAQIAAADLATMCTRDLLPAGVLEPA